MTLKRQNNMGNGFCALENIWKHTSCTDLTLQLWIYGHFGRKWPWKQVLTLKMTLKQQNNIENGFCTFENIRKHMQTYENIHHEQIKLFYFELMVISSEKGPWKQALTLNTTLKRHNNIGNGLCTLENVWKHVSCIYLSLIWIFDHFGQKWPWKHDLTLKTTLKRETNTRNGLLTPENIWNHIKHMTLTIIRRFSWSSGGHIGLVHTGHKGAWPLCLRWFLNSP